MYAHRTNEDLHVNIECFRTAEAFIKHCPDITDLRTLADEFGRSTRKMGFRYFACGSHSDPLHPSTPIMLLNYPAAWVATYSEQQLHRIDPVFKQANASPSPFHWDDPIFTSQLDDGQHAMIASAREFGIEHGYTVPVHSRHLPPLFRASCSLVPDSRMLPRYSFFAAELMAIRLFVEAIRIVGLTKSTGVPSLSAPESRSEEVEHIVSTVARLTGVDRDELFSRSQRRQVVLARAVIAWHVSEGHLATLTSVASDFYRSTASLSVAIGRYRRIRPDLFQRDALQ
jgi:hypothetical protein